MSDLPPPAKVLKDCPTDGITALKYLPDKPTLLASSSWDGSLYLHDTATTEKVVSHAMESGPLLSFATFENDLLVTGGMNGSLGLLDINRPDEHTILARQDGKGAAYSCMSSLGGSGTVATGSWDGTFRVWDIRQRGSVPAATVSLPGKAFSMDATTSPTGHLVTVATAARRLCFVDVRKVGDVITAEMVLDRESSLKFQTRCIKFFPDGNAVTFGSVEGRVSVEYLEELDRPAVGKKYTFKCHRVGDLVYPVNCIEFHPKFGTFCTGGCEGSVGTYR